MDPKALTGRAVGQAEQSDGVVAVVTQQWTERGDRQLACLVCNLANVERATLNKSDTTIANAMFNVILYTNAVTMCYFHLAAYLLASVNQCCVCWCSHLLGHEGEGSVFALLKKLGWATSLSAGESGNSLSSRSVFMIHIELTDTGVPPCTPETLYLQCFASEAFLSF